MVDNGSDLPLGSQTPDGALEVRLDIDGPCYTETALGQHQRWLRQAPDLYGKYQDVLAEVATLRATAPAPDPVRGTPQLEPLDAEDAEQGVPEAIRRELMSCAVSNGRISYVWLLRLYKRGVRDGREASEGVLSMAVHRLGGMVEGRPTERVNFLQRIDELRRIEAVADPPLVSGRQDEPTR